MTKSELHNPHELIKKLQVPTRKAANPRKMLPLIDPVPPETIENELKTHCELLYDSSPNQPHRGVQVFTGVGNKIPNVLRELGRLREETFRTVGEGTGLSQDNDRFDDHYDHLMAWHKSDKVITGAYRIGRLDEILKSHGPSGVYTNELFHLGTLLTTDFATDTLELGRSFVSLPYQRGATLLCLWVGITRIMRKFPYYKDLIGPVSISNEFQENSKHLMVHYLMQKFSHEKSRLVKSKNPPRFDSNLSPEELAGIVDHALDLKALQEFVRHAEQNPKAEIPQLIKLYLEVGVRFLAFNRDQEFNTIDGLIWTDLSLVPPEILGRYMGKAETLEFQQYHRNKAT